MDSFELPGSPPHDRWMRLALDEARAAAAEDEVPVGAVVVAGGRVVAAATTSGSNWPTPRPMPR
jgi:tRNA(Arg) A34 adenosine deaminase TadA